MNEASSSRHTTKRQIGNLSFYTWMLEEFVLQLIPTTLKDVVILEPKVFGDERGFFLEAYNEATDRKSQLLHMDAGGVCVAIDPDYPEGRSNSGTQGLWR